MIDAHISTKLVAESVLSEMLYTDNLDIISKTMGVINNKFNKWKHAYENSFFLE